MPLSDFKPAVRVVAFPGGCFAVRGLSTQDLMFLLQHYGHDLQAVFEQFRSASDASALSLDDPASVTARVMTTAPALVHHVIAIAAEELDQRETIARLPFPVQINALEQIGAATFETSGGLKNGVETVVRYLRELNASIPALSKR